MSHAKHMRKEAMHRNRGRTDRRLLNKIIGVLEKCGCKTINFQTAEIKEKGGGVSGDRPAIRR